MGEDRRNKENWNILTFLITWSFAPNTHGSNHRNGKSFSVNVDIMSALLPQLFIAVTTSLKQKLAYKSDSPAFQGAGSIWQRFHELRPGFWSAGTTVSVVSADTMRGS